MQPVAVAQLLILLALANGTPVIVRWLLRERWAWPLDGGLAFLDGRPMFGTSKTLRGVAAALVATTAAAPLIGVAPATGFWAAGTAMAGDLLSSFVKRRLGLKPSSQAFGLDQIPESLFPALACRFALSLDAVDIAVTVALFTVGEVLLSRLLYRLRIRERPY